MSEESDKETRKTFYVSESEYAQLVAFADVLNGNSSDRITRSAVVRAFCVAVTKASRTLKSVSSEEELVRELSRRLGARCDKGT